MKETTRQAAQRHKLAVSTLYRRLVRLTECGRVTINPADYVGGALYLDAIQWDEVCKATRSPGRPKKSHDSRMFAKGYRYKLEFLNRDCDPLYAKTIDDIGPLMRQWPEDRFDLVKLD